MVCHTRRQQEVSPTTRAPLRETRTRWSYHSAPPSRAFPSLSLSPYPPPASLSLPASPPLSLSRYLLASRSAFRPAFRPAFVLAIFLSLPRSFSSFSSYLDRALNGQSSQCLQRERPEPFGRVRGGGRPSHCDDGTGNAPGKVEAVNLHGGVNDFERLDALPDVLIAPLDRGARGRGWRGREWTGVDGKGRW